MTQTVTVTSNKKSPVTKDETVAASPAVMAALAHKFGDMHKIAVRRASEETRDWLRGKHPLSNIRDLETARLWARIIPDRGQLSIQNEKFYAAVFAPATQNEIRLIVAAIIDGIPHAGATASLGFIESLIFALEHVDDDQTSNWTPREGYSLAVLFAAARRIITTSKFCPAICEIVAEAEQVRDLYLRAMRATDRLAELRASADEIIEDIEFQKRVEAGEFDGDDLPE